MKAQRPQFEWQDNHYLMRKNLDGSQTWLKGFGPHVGYAKMAIASTSGVNLWGQDGVSGQRGMSNPNVYAEFPGGPDKNVEREIWKKYHELAQAAADARKNGTAKKKPEPTGIKRLPKGIPVRTWIVRVDKKALLKNVPGEYDTCDYPEMTFSGVGMKRFDALDAYEAWYNKNHTNPRTHGDALGWAVFHLKAREVK